MCRCSAPSLPDWQGRGLLLSDSERCSLCDSASSGGDVESIFDSSPASVVGQAAPPCVRFGYFGVSALALGVEVVGWLAVVLCGDGFGAVGGSGFVGGFGAGENVSENS